ncbi:endonuclease/exonuclease/phosphatase family protein [Sulfitobacter donghicola]|uniref:Endonuclease n=1 Tax=Sulfitobacter donghicola DSW-25 = KCTC 12864 = JCM 14565 TaxID=1300350 RepID=A0A073IK19_9RHOB|nr:endonuclease/exonuclease/phosphatase family protein [Sulfitobacter donghicola]KEJ89925.1 endonuclease [Sulfitobacter donghicola DSW-25 = KCTC 12864 = JCM 14565]KIN66950.1 Endonuclease/exonuclease/phosphatase family protein [Sulfitobacter donghicola DSW-25 = KCTC 12864 = JCM 14565]
MRIATYNVEWFAGLFDQNDELFNDSAWSRRWNVTRAQQTEALGTVFRAMDADAIMVIEAPDHGRNHSAVAALEHFAQQFDIRARRAVIGFANDTQQEIVLLYDPDVMTAAHDPMGEESGTKGARGAPRFDGSLRIDLDFDASEDRVVFSKPPLELAVETRSGFAFRMIGAHLKSKAPHGARDDNHAMQIAIANRRKQLAQAIWLRERIDAHITDQTPLILMGDLNDGPGLDEFENLFGRSSVEIILGADSAHPLYDPHAMRALSQRIGAVPTTSRFWIRPEKRFLQALLDYIMVCPALRAHAPQWRIWHPLDDPACWADQTLREALVTASDHFPVTLDIDL